MQKPILPLQVLLIPLGIQLNIDVCARGLLFDGFEFKLESLNWVM